MENLPIILAILTISLSPSVLCQNLNKTTTNNESTTNANLEIVVDLRTTPRISSYNKPKLNGTNIFYEDKLKNLHKNASTPFTIGLYNRGVNLQQLLNYNETEMNSTTDKTIITKFWPLYQYNRDSLIEIKDIDPTLIDLRMACDKMNYISRSFNPRNLSIDTPMELARNLISPTEKSDRFLVIMGGRESGKTVTLVKILNELRKIDKVSWTLAVDLAKINPKPKWEVMDIFLQVLDESSHKLFHQVLKNNPSKINILLDNYDRIDENIREEILNFCLEYYAKGTGIILTTSHHLDKDFFVQFEHPKFIEIPKLDESEMETYFIQKWVNLSRTTTCYKKLQIYAKIVSLLISNFEIFQTFGTINRLSKLLYYGDSNIFLSNSLKSVEEYCENQFKYNPPELMNILSNIRLNKMALLDQLISPPVSGSLDDAVDANGEIALQSILEYDMIKPYHFRQYPQMKSEYIYYPKPTFVNLEINRYFAAKYISKMNKTDDIINDLLIILSSKKHGRVAEYINGYLMNNSNTMEFEHFFNFKVRTPGMQSRIIHYAIENGFDNVIFNILKNNDSIEMLDYMLNYFVLSVKSTIEYKFGLIVPAINSKSPMNVTRLEMLLKMKMEKSQSLVFNMIKKYGKDVDVELQENFKKYLQDIVLSDTKPSMKIYQSIINILKSLDKNFLNQLMFTVFSHAGNNSIEIVKDLINRGADVNAIDAKGRNLIHVAIQKSDPELLHFVVGNLGLVILDTPSKSILIEALDANPFHWFSRPQFWEMMAYLLTNANLTVPDRQHPQVTSRNIGRLAQNDKQTPFYNLLTETKTDIVPRLISKLLFVDLQSANLSSNILSRRRHYILQNYYKNPKRQSDAMTLTELLLAYRGLDALDSVEEQYFFKVINIALRRDTVRPLSSFQWLGISEKICSNIGTINDLKNVLNWFDHMIMFNTLNDDYVPLIVDRLLLCVTKKVSSPSSSLGLEKSILLTRSKIFSQQFTHENPNVHTLLVQLQSFSTKNPYYGSECIVKHVEENPDTCRISKDDVEKFVTVETKNGVTTNFIDTEKLNNLIDDDMDTEDNYIRSDQLIGAAAMMLFQNDYKLSATQQSVILKLLESGSLGISMSGAPGFHRYRLLQWNKSLVPDLVIKPKDPENHFEYPDQPSFSNQNLYDFNDNYGNLPDYKQAPDINHEYSYDTTIRPFYIPAFGPKSEPNDNIHDLRITNIEPAVIAPPTYEDVVHKLPKYDTSVIEPPKYEHPPSYFEAVKPAPYHPSFSRQG